MTHRANCIKRSFINLYTSPDSYEKSGPCGTGTRKGEEKRSEDIGAKPEGKTTTGKIYA